MTEVQTPFYKKKWFLIAVPILIIFSIISNILEKSEQDKIQNEQQEEQRLLLEYQNSDRYRDSVASWELYTNSDRYKDSILVLDKTDNFKDYVKISNLEWKTGGFGSVAILKKIEFTNESLVDVKNIKVSFEFKAETNDLVNRVEREFKIIVKAGESRIIKDENLGFIDKQAQSVSYSIKSLEKYE